ncbi:MAG: 3-phosphoshikimate 1-carboxyvinyltransferase [Acidobacteriota bacterium]|jgi:3-phosphoshikimate 1-carboxyvinyltransferase
MTPSNRSGSITVAPGGPLTGTARVPSSKSVTHRALFCAALAPGRSVILSPSICDDTLATRACLEALGARIEVTNAAWFCSGTGGRLSVPTNPINCASSGTTFRFLSTLCALSPGIRRLDGSEQLRRRPMDALDDIVRQAGARLRWLKQDGRAPVEIEGGRPGIVTIHAPSRVTSQFLSGLLLAAPLLGRPLSVFAADPVSAPYVETTRRIMALFGVAVERPAPSEWRVPELPYRTTRFKVEADASAAAFLFAAAGVTGGSVTVPGIGRSMAQGDARILEFLENFGLRVEVRPGGASVSGSVQRGVDLDLGAHPDLVPALAALALAAPSPSRFRRIGHLRHKESDRLALLAEAVKSLGGIAEVEGGTLSIQPSGTYRPARLDPKGDHRMAMAFAVMGLLAPGTEISDPGCVRKSFPDFFEVLDSLRRPL